MSYRINDKLKELKTTLSREKFKDIQEIINRLKFFSKIEWKFFHPFFNMLIENFSYIVFKDLYFNKSDNFVICFFQIKNQKMTNVDLISILYTSIDEICGNFVYLLDENIFVTSEISLDNMKNLSPTNSGEIQEEHLNFLCLVNLKETSNNRRKIVFDFNLFFLTKNITENLDNYYYMKEYLSGSSIFKRLNKNISMSKF